MTINIADRVVAGLFIFSTWAVLFLIFTGVGLTLRRAFGMKIRGSENVFQAFWIGWASIILFLQLWHLQFRIGWQAFTVVAIVGAEGLLCSRHDVSRFAWQKLSSQRGFLVLLAIVGMAIANQANDAPLHYDTYVYAMQSIRWNSTFPIVPGLGNLHGRLAFNSTHYLYMALLEVGPWVRKSHHLANGLLTLVLLAQMLLSAKKLISPRVELRLYHILHVLLFAPLTFLVFRATQNTISSGETDTAVFILGVVIATELLSYLDGPNRSGREAVSTVLFVTLLGAIGITIKLSFLAMGAVTVLLVLGVYYRRLSAAHWLEHTKVFAWATIIVALALVPWMIRGVILSGYIAYPIPIGGFPVDWRIPKPAVIDEVNSVAQGLLRGPEAQFGIMFGYWDWISNWIARAFDSQQAFALFSVALPVTLGLVAAILAIVLRLLSIRPLRAQRAQWLFLLPTLACALYWFSTAASPRFAGACLWLLGAGATTLVLGSYGGLGRKVVITIAFPLTVAMIIFSFRFENFSLFSIKPGEYHGFYPARVVATETIEMSDGLLVHVPTDGAGDQCQGAPLPCSPYPERVPELRLRKGGDLSSGFRIAYILLPDEVPSDIYPIQSRLGDSITLLGYTISQEGQTIAIEDVSTGPLTLRLYWQVLDQNDSDYTIFVHSQDSTGQLAATVDAPPFDGSFPTSLWAKDEVFVTTHNLVLPVDGLSFYAGMYSWPSLERLQAFQNGQHVSDNRIVLWEVDN